MKIKKFYFPKHHYVISLLNDYALCVLLVRNYILNKIAINIVLVRMRIADSGGRAV